MGIKVHGPPQSTAVARVLMTLYEKDVEDSQYELVPVDMMKGAHKSPDYLKLQPFGKVPVAVMDDFVLFESRAIARTIARKYTGQGTPLYGTTLKDEALVEQWVEVEAHNIQPLMSTFVWEVIVGPMFGSTTNEELVNATVEKLGAVLDVYEKHLSTSKYLAGDFFSLADLSHMPGLVYLFIQGKRADMLESRPAVKAWWTDITSRPSWKKYEELAHPRKY